MEGVGESTLLTLGAARSGRRSRRMLIDLLFIGGLRAVALLSVVTVLAIIGVIIAKGLPTISWSFLTSPPQEGMTSGGIYPMIRGSVLLMLGTLVIVLPIGVLGGVFLAEYAGQNVFSRFIHASVASLAGTPSVIFGLFGLAVFVIMMQMGVSLLAGCLTLALFTLPAVVFTTENAIRSVPESFIEAGMALGLSRWQILWKIVLPNAMPGILTGVVLSTGRAAGEAPPILLTAGIYYATGSLPRGWDILKQPVANLPYHLAEGYRQGGVIPEAIVWGTCLTLMLFVLIINIWAIMVRVRVRRRQRW
ncbi:MAG: phosphate ABC transporter permease PstA [Armatimonadota bacterium]|nr:phosphate ABC transporter permease PstA [bacterium]MCS7310512.1 phosphate ABC transporter permease PstA [Armatimonadota bacterium]MDW8105360.1 phosphate ABC transporter permease PstA [Armatimonadota bacterium]MDW8289900.1 phosphate ABC transporter permease PstA [Armatimonadota bacterium]